MGFERKRAVVIVAYGDEVSRRLLIKALGEFLPDSIDPLMIEARDAAEAFGEADSLREAVVSVIVCIGAEMADVHVDDSFIGGVPLPIGLLDALRAMDFEVVLLSCGRVVNPRSEVPVLDPGDGLALAQLLVDTVHGNHTSHAMR